MSVAIRRAGLVVLTIAAAVLLALTATMTSAFTLAATTALIMGGTGHPLSTPPETVGFVQQYMATAVVNYIDPAGIQGPVTNRVAVITPEQFRFDTGLRDMKFDDSVAVGRQNLDNCIQASGCVYNGEVGSAPPASTDTFVVFGYSQSATIATLEKRALAEQYPAGTGPDVSFVLIANPNRPNGGILERFEGAYIPILGVTASGATPTDTQYQTVDITRQYDGWSDFPTNPLNLLADLNAGMGILYLHGDYGSVSLGDAVLQDQYGDTTYYLVPTDTVPLLMPVAQVPILGPVAADTLDPVARVLVEAGYNRTVSPGKPTTARFTYFPNPLKLGANLIVAVPTGVDNGLSDVTGTRPLGTQEPGPYGVGGPDVTLSPTTNEQAADPVPVSVAAVGPTPAPAPEARQSLPRPVIGSSRSAVREPGPIRTATATRPTLPKLPKPLGSHPLKDLASSLSKPFKPFKPAKAAPGDTGEGSPASDSPASGS